MPTGGHSEPVRGLAFYLLRKSLEDIRLEAEKADPPPDMDRFIDSLEGSPELKDWMKKHHTVDLQGKDFTSHLTGEEIVGVKEFLDAYAALNGGTHSGGFPEPKYKESEKTKNPEKYEREHAQYIVAMQKFVKANPDSLAGLDVELTDKNPGRRWSQSKASSANAPNAARCNWRKASTWQGKPNPARTAADRSPNSLPELIG